MVFRVTVPAKKLEGIKELGDLATIPRNNHWIGPRATILSYLLEGINETLVNFVFTCDVDLGSLEDGVNQKKGTNQDVRNAFKDWDPRIDLMLEHVTEVLEWRVSAKSNRRWIRRLTFHQLYTHQEAPSWIHPSNKLCLIGDSAHAMTPYLAQGAAMGFEDAAILGGALEICPSTETLPQALRLYEKLRLKRSAMVAAASIESRYFTQMEDGPEQQKRDEWLLEHPGIWTNHINIRSRREFLNELFGYDAYKELEAGLSSSDFLSSIGLFDQLKDGTTYDSQNILSGRHLELTSAT
jgi:salicylate hydroxylase